MGEVMIKDVVYYNPSDFLTKRTLFKTNVEINQNQYIEVNTAILKVMNEVVTEVNIFNKGNAEQQNVTTHKTRWVYDHLNTTLEPSLKLKSQVLDNHNKTLDDLLRGRTVYDYGTDISIEKINDEYKIQTEYNEVD